MKIFVSWQIQDVDFTKRLISSLRQIDGTMAYSVDILGKNITDLFEPDKLYDALDRPDITIIVLSRNYIADQWMGDEARALVVIEKHVKPNFIIPILIDAIDENEIPFSLRGKDRVDFREATYEEAFAQLTPLILNFAAKPGGAISRSISAEPDRSFDAADVLEQLFSRFHTAVRQLRARHDERPTLDISDEYDVQDLLHALLRLFFDDIRAEEWTPGYAGGSSRVDFLLKKEQIVVEVKKTRPTLKSKQLGEQLIIDIARYKVHPDCRTLYCFIYDPEGQISNPQGIENDLSRDEGEMIVKVQIAPKSR